ncbi:hypothetical protein BGZ81_000829 [Podila clonocystis]|nr:hypothetical protein BGZ81_000829 [Podila clonocystis]
MDRSGRQDNSSEPQRQPIQDPTIPTTAGFNESDHSSEDDTDQDEIYPRSPSTSTSLAIRFTTRETMDLYDKLPPELLEHILTLLPHPTLFFCTTLSKRWARMDDTVQEPVLAWDNFSDHEDEDPSGLLRLAENQRRENDTNTKPSFVVSSRPFNVQGKSHLCPYVDMPSSSSLALPLEVVTNTIGISTATSHKHISSKRQKKNSARSSLPSPGLVPSPPSKPFLRPSYGSLIRTLDFSELYYILSDKFLTHLFPHTPQLATLIVSAPKQFTDESLYVLATCCRALQRCELLGCDQITDRGVHFLLEQQHQQETKNLSDNGSRGAGSTLRILSLANRASITDGVLQHLAYVTFASKLERLNLANAVFVTGQDPGLGTVFRCCTGLKALNVSHCQGVTDELLGTLGRVGS